MNESTEIVTVTFGKVWSAFGGGEIGSGPTREDALHALALALINAPKVDEDGRCVTCGHRHTEYSFRLNKSLANLMRRLFDVGGIAEITRIGQTNTEYANISKLQFWDLVVPHITPENARKRGWWELTSLGECFVTGVTDVHQQVIVCGKKFVRFEGPLVSFSSLKPDILHYGDYADQARDGINQPKKP